jgi:S-formylglutathione hydrolase FrmB
MSLHHIHYYSQSLQKHMGMYVAVPDVEGPHRVVYQLHGLSDDYTVWLRRTSIERHAEKFGLMIVMPDGGRSFYTDAVSGPRFEAHMLETIRYIDRTFRTVDGPHGRGIGGLSMGGYGSMKLGLKHPELFGSIASHSGALDMRYRSIDSPAFLEELRFIYGPEVQPEQDCFALAERPGRKPAIYFDCGVDDFLLDHNRRFAEHLRTLGVKHTYKEHPGAHTWEYWDRHVPTALRFHWRHMK